MFSPAILDFHTALARLKTYLHPLHSSEGEERGGGCTPGPREKNKKNKGG
jgi:hypothetical protein